MITPQQFAQALRNSTLDPEDKLAVLDLLPSLDQKTIEEIGEILKHDVNAQEKVLRKAELKMDVLMQQFEKDFPKDT